MEVTEVLLDALPTEAAAAPTDETLTIEFRQRCYSLYLWAYTMSVSGGAVNFDVDDDFVKQHGWKYSLIFQQSVAAGVARGRTTSPSAPYYPEFNTVLNNIIKTVSS